MPRIQTPAQPPLLARILNQIAKRMYGKPFPSVALMGLNPAYLLGYSGVSFAGALARTELSSEIKELANLLVAQVNGCAFCLDLAHRVAQDTGMSAQKRQRVLEFQTRPDLYTPREVAAMQYALEVTQMGARVSDATFAELKSYFSDREIMELTVVVATENFYNRINAPLEIESQGLCALALHQGPPAPQRSA